MTGPEAQPAPDGLGTPGAPIPTGPPGAATFSLEGRAAPGLYFVGWLGTILGLALLLVALLSGGQIAGVVLALIGVVLLSVGLVSAAGAQALQRRRRTLAPQAAPGGASEEPGAASMPNGAPEQAAADQVGAVGSQTGDAKAGYAGPSPFLVFAASLPLTVLVVGVLIVPFLAAGFSITSPAAALLSVVLTTLVYVILVRLLVVGTGALAWRDMGVRAFDSGALRDLGSGAVLALPIVLLTAVLAEILVRILGATPDSPLPLSTDNLGFVSNLVAAAVIAPIGEELFFRGFATTAWARGMGERRGLIRGAIFFAVVHVLTTGGVSFGDAFAKALVAFVGRVPVSVALGWIFLRRRSLYASIGLHATFNATLVILSEVAARTVGF